MISNKILLLCLLYALFSSQTAHKLNFDDELGNKRFLEYQDQKLDVEDQLHDIETSIEELSGQTEFNLKQREFDSFREPLIEFHNSYQEDDPNASGVKHSKVISTWDQTPSTVNEAETGLKRGETVGFVEDPQINRATLYNSRENPRKKSMLNSASKRFNADRHKSNSEKYFSRNPGADKYNRLNHMNSKSIREKEAFKPKRNAPDEELMSSLIDNWMLVTGLIKDNEQENEPSNNLFEQAENNTSPSKNEFKNSQRNNDSQQDFLNENTVIPTPVYTITLPPHIEPPTAMTIPPTVKTETKTPSSCHKSSLLATTTLEPPKNSTTFMQKLKNVFKKIFSKKKDEEPKPAENLTDEEIDLVDSLLSYNQLDEVSFDDPKKELDAYDEKSELLVEVNQPLTKSIPPSKHRQSSGDTPKTSNKTSTDANLLKDFSDTDLSFLKNLLYCMKNSNPNFSNNAKNSVTDEKIKQNLTKTKEVSQISFNSEKLSNSSKFTQTMFKNQTFTKNFTQFVIECQPIVVNYSNVTGQQYLNFNCTKTPIDNNSTKINRNINNKTLSNENALLNKLKFLAHSHHPVDLVGKQPLKVVDLKAIEDQIENAKYGDLYSDDNETIDAETSPQNPGDGAVTGDSENKSHDSKSKDHSKRSLNNLNNEDDDPFAVDAQEVAPKSVYTDYDALFKDAKQRRHKNGQSLKPSYGTQAKESNNAQTEVSEKFSDFDDIQLKLTPEQEMDIHKFSQSLDERPQPFHFDVDKYVAEQQTKLEHKSLVKPVINSETPRKFFEFDDKIEPEDELLQLKNGVPVNQDDEDGSNQEHEDNNKDKRDLNTKFEAYRNLVREQNSALPVSYDVDSFHANSYKKELEKSKTETKDKFLDNYYLLNNGIKDSDAESKTPIGHKEMIPNSIDLDIDLKLNKEFLDLQFERDRILHRDVLENDMMTFNKQENNIKQDVFNDIR